VTWSAAIYRRFGNLECGDLSPLFRRWRVPATASPKDPKAAVNCRSPKMKNGDKSPQSKDRLMKINEIVRRLAESDSNDPRASACG
jgi:hypothetical protein